MFRKIKHNCKSTFNQIAVGQLFQALVRTVKLNYDSWLVNSEDLINKTLSLKFCY